MPTFSEPLKTINSSGTDSPYQFGHPFDVSFSLENGKWIETDDGRIWTITIKSEGASTLNFAFENLSLSTGATIEITSSNRNMIYGPVTKEDIPKNGRLLTSPIIGDQATICLYEPTEYSGTSTLTIRRVIHGLSDSLWNTLSDSCLEKSSPCNINVACHPEFSTESQAVCMIITSDGTRCCSGALITNTSNDFAPYVLTAFHCVDGSRDGTISSQEKDSIQDWLFVFGWKYALCDLESYAMMNSYQGASLKAAWKDSDFALLKLFDNLSANLNLRWLGWDKSDAIPTEGACIHHPQGDIMKISIEDDTFTSSKWNNVGPTNHWKVNFDEGITQGASSGGPLLDQNHRVVGQLHGAIEIPEDTCAWTTSWYGKFSESWNGGGTPETRLSDWLDSIGTNQMTTDLGSPISLLSIDGPTVPEAGTIYTVNSLLPEYRVKWSFVGTDFVHPGDTASDIPTYNGFRLNNARKQYVRGTLTAKVYDGDTLLTTLTKFIHSGANFSGTYEQDAILSANIPATAPTSLQCNWRYTMWRGSMITLRSNNFNGATVTYTGETPVIWAQHADSIAFFLYYHHGLIPLVDGLNYNYPTTDFEITCTFPNSYDVFYFKIHPFAPNSNFDPYTPLSLGIRRAGSKVFISLKELTNMSADLFLSTYNIAADASLTDYTQLKGWHLTILDSQTGKVVFNNVVLGEEQAVNTESWPPGTYILNAQYGPWKTAKKILVKN